MPIDKTLSLHFHEAGDGETKSIPIDEFTSQCLVSFIHRL
jgi:hypothetical protein